MAFHSRQPNFGLNLDILKVEVGGDTDSTEGAEPSHMHGGPGDENYNRGYEWWLMKEAKARNPDVKLYGLSWAVPGWIGDACTKESHACSMDAQYYHGNDNIDYHLKWIAGAKSAHNLTIDYLGIWNERASDPDWIVRLRAALDAAGHEHVTIVASDTSFGVCDGFAANKTVADAIGVGAHCKC
eukprot:SAG22_NODE_6001_length_918_cov_0.714286_1_plen_184_part_00